MATPGQDKYVRQLLPADVLFGRGSGPNDHEGNIRFRQLVAERKNEYMATNHRMTKAKIAKEIVDQVFQANGRFMKKVEPADMKALGFVEGTDVWEIVGDDTIMEKAKQALRQNTQKHKGNAAASTSGTAGGEDADKQKKQQQQQTHQQLPQQPQGVAQTSPVARTNRLQQSSMGRPGGGGGGFGDFEPLPISPGSFESGGAGFNQPGSAPPQQQGVPPPRQQMMPGAPMPPHMAPQPWTTDRHGNMIPSQLTAPHAMPPHHHHHHHHAPVPPPPPQQHAGGGGGMTPLQQQQHEMMAARSQMAGVRKSAAASANANNNNPMLNYIRRASYEIPPQQQQQAQQQQQQQHRALPPQPDASNLSMAQLPDDMGAAPPAPSARHTNRQGSLHLADLQTLNDARNASTTRPATTPGGAGGGEVMHDLMDSFNKMRATGELNPKFHASVDTMGTIEHINPGSIADMSLGTMGSSTFSLFRGNDSLAAMDDKLAQIETAIQAESSNKEEPPTPPPPTREGSIHFGPTSETAVNATTTGAAAAAPSSSSGGGGGAPPPPHPSSSSSKNNTTSHANNNMSMNLSDVWAGGPRRKSSSTGTVMSGIALSGGGSSLSSSISMASSIRNTNDNITGALSFAPRPIGLMEEQPNNMDLSQMGSSSMSVLKAAYTITEDENAINPTIRPQTFYLGDHHHHTGGAANTATTAATTHRTAGAAGGGDEDS